MRVVQRCGGGQRLPAAAGVLALGLADLGTVRLASTVRELCAAGDAGETGHATPLIEGKANGSSASWFPRAPIAGFAQDTPFSRASARTGNVPTPRNFGGTALNSNPSSGTAARLHRCSTTQIGRASGRERMCQSV